MVSAANSFGLMDGGIDKCITDFFGDQLPKRVREYIIGEYGGCQPIGTSFIIETQGEKYVFQENGRRQGVTLYAGGQTIHF